MKKLTREEQISAEKQALEGAVAVLKRQNVWRRRFKWGLPFLAAFLPIVLLSFYSVQIATKSVNDLVQSEEIAAVGNISQLLTQTVRQSASLITAFSSVPGTIDAVQSRDAISLNTRMKAMIVSFPEISTAMITDGDGVLWSMYPPTISEYGSSHAHTSWFKEVMETGKTSVSEMYVSQHSGEPVIAFSSPIVSNGTFLGTATFEYPTKTFRRWLDSIDLSHGGHILLIDQTGKLAAHPTNDVITNYDAYKNVPEIERARQGVVHTSEYTDPLTEQTMIATFLPVSVGRHMWVVVAQQPTALAYGELRSVWVNIGMAGAVLTLFTLAIVIALGRTSSRNIRLNAELQVKNQQLREVASIVESSNDAIIVEDIKGRIKMWNSSAEETFGYTAKEMVGKNINTIVPEDKHQELKEMLMSIQKGEGINNFETERIHKNGKLIPVSLTLSPVEDEYGRVVGLSSIDRDITERKEVEQMKNDFISFVSHQLKAPVTALRWIIEEILDGDYGEVPEQLREPLQEMNQVNQGNYKLITDILNVSRIDRGVIEFESVDVQLREIAEKAMHNYTKAIEKAGLTLTTTGFDQDILVHADADKMAEAVSNAISNSIKHTKEGGITVRLSVSDGFGVIEVEDTGEGMPPEIKKKLFTRDQILGGHARPEESAGLGLFIAQNFMQLQGGDISVESEKGRGTKLIFRIPLQN